MTTFRLYVKADKVVLTFWDGTFGILLRLVIAHYR